MKSISARCGHVKRRLNQGEPLEGELLEFALDLVEGGIVKEGVGNSNDELLENLGRGKNLVIMNIMSWWM